MKKIIISLICSIIILVTTGCNNKVPLNYETEETNTFNGTILECGSSNMIVKPNENELESKSSDKIVINFVGDFNNCNVNDKVIITYIGGIAESYPAQVKTIKIELVK